MFRDACRTALLLPGASPAMKFRWFRTLRRWSAEVRAWEPPETFGQDVSVIILAYARRQNVPLQLHAILRHPRISRVTVSVNRAFHPFPRAWKTRDPRVCFIDQNTDRSTLSRYAIALRDSTSRFLFIDDDVFLTPAQIDLLIRKLDENPSVPHGFIGQIYDSWMDRMHHYVRDHEGPVDVLNCVYALTDEHLRRFFDVQRQIQSVRNVPLKFFGIADDMLLSHTGNSKPELHRGGNVLLCPSASSEGIAGNTMAGFFFFRMKLFKLVRSLRLLRNA